MVQNRIRRKVFGDFAEAGLQAGLAPGAADARLGIADDPRRTVDDPGLQQRTEGEIRGGRVAARVRDQPRAGNPLAAELGQAVDGFGQQFRLGVGLLVPGGVVLGSAQAEGAAQVHYAGAGRQHQRREFHGDFGRRGQEDHIQLLLAYRVGGTGDAHRQLRAANDRRPAVVFPVIHQDGFDMCVFAQYADQFRTAVAPITDDSYPFHV